MNRLEAAYASHLDSREDVLKWQFESHKLRLADRTFYTPDFGVLVQLPDGSAAFEFHEVKGFWEDDARVKIKVAAELFWMFPFVGITRRLKRDGGGWEEERF